MLKEDFKLDQQVTINVTDKDGNVVQKDGIIKGASTDCQGNVTVQVEHLISTTSSFKLEDVVLK